VTLVAASLGFAVVQLDVFVVNVGMKQIGASLGGGTAGLQWVVGGYTLVFAALILTAGAMGDRWGARRMLSIGFVVFTLASMLCGAAPDLAVLIVGRGLQGAGAALLSACSLALLNHAFHDRTARDRAVGLWAAGASVALAGGPVVGGVLIAAIGWRAIFFINLPLGAAGLLLTRHTDEAPITARRIDVPGQLAAICVLTALAGGLIEAGPRGWADPFVIGALLLALVALGVFTAVERSVREPMLPLDLFGRTGFTAPALLGLVANIAFYGLIFVFSLYLQRVRGDTALQAGLAFLPLTTVVLGANLCAARLAGRYGARIVILGGLAGMTLGCLALLRVQGATPVWAIFGPQVLLGGGLGLVVPPMTTTLMSAVDRSRSGVAAGALTTMRQAGSVFGVALFGSMIGAGGFAAGFHRALLCSVGLALLAMLFALPIGTRPPPGRANEARMFRRRERGGPRMRGA
jgi:DHA2 family methylenomycin A resistance protein-like MFS transporter